MPAYFNIGSRNETSERDWHGGMLTHADTALVTEAMQACGMDYEYRLEPAQGAIEWNGVVYTARVPRAFDLWRGPVDVDGERQPRLIGRKGNRYSIIQNNALGRILDPLTDVWPCSTVGVLNDWTLTFATLKMDPFTVGGYDQELHEAWLATSDDRGKAGSAAWGVVTERIVCRNTYLRAKQSAREWTSIPHTGDTELELQFRADLELQAAKARIELQEQLDLLFKKPATEALGESIFAAAFPYPATPRTLVLAQEARHATEETDAINSMLALADSKQEWLNGQIQRADSLRDEARAFVPEFNDTYPYAANSAYALFQAATQVISNSPQWRGGSDKQFNSLWFGDRAEASQRALAAALEN